MFQRREEEERIYDQSVDCPGDLGWASAQFFINMPTQYIYILCCEIGDCVAYTGGNEHRMQGMAHEQQHQQIIYNYIHCNQTNMIYIYIQLQDKRVHVIATEGMHCESH